MRLVQKLLSTLVGLVFTTGAAGKVAAREGGPATSGTVVNARGNVTTGQYDSQENRLILLAAAANSNKNNEKNNKDTKNKTKNKTKEKTKDKTKKTKTKPKSPKK